MSILKALWGQLFDKVKVVVIVGFVSIAGAILDLFLNIDWTSLVGGTWSTVIALAVASVVAFAKKELSGLFQTQVEEEVVQPLPPVDETVPPPVG